MNFNQQGGMMPNQMPGMNMQGSMGMPGGMNMQMNMPGMNMGMNMGGQGMPQMQMSMGGMGPQPMGMSNWAQTHECGLQMMQLYNKECTACKQNQSGFFMQCEKCKIYICQMCCNKFNYSMQNTQCHPSHPLKLKKGNSFKCDVCKKSKNNVISFGCKPCDFDCCADCYFQAGQPMQPQVPPMVNPMPVQPVMPQPGYDPMAMQNMKNDYEKRLSDLTNEKNKVNTQLTQKTNEITKLNKTITDKSNEITKLNKTITDKNNEINKLNKQLNDKNNEITKLNKQITDKNTEINKLNAQITQLKNVQPMNPYPSMNPMNPYPAVQPMVQPMVNPMMPQAMSSQEQYFTYGAMHEHGMNPGQYMNTECIACKQNVSGLFYACPQCQIYVCQNCCNSFFYQRKPNPQVHPQHMLKIVKRDSFKCDVCKKSKKKAMSCYCKDCDFDCCSDCYFK